MDPRKDTLSTGERTARRPQSAVCLNVDWNPLAWADAEIGDRRMARARPEVCISGGGPRTTSGRHIAPGGDQGDDPGAARRLPRCRRHPRAPLAPHLGLLARAGLRLGEALALEWTRVDLAGREFRVARTLAAG